MVDSGTNLKQSSQHLQTFQNSTTKSKMFSTQRNSVQPPSRRLNIKSPSPLKNGIRIVESGELRVVNRAAKQQWNFAQDNSKQLQRHLHELRFSERKQDGFQSKDTPAILVRVGLTNLNTTSMENLATFGSSSGG